MRRPAGIGFAIAVAIVAGAFASCTSTPKDEADPNVVPVNYKKEILDTLPNTLGYPTKVRDAFVSEPALTPVGKDNRYTACLRYNPRDGENHYAGSKDQIAYFYGGHLNQLVDATPEQCAKAAYKPFPELEKFCYAGKCF